MKRILIALALLGLAVAPAFAQTGTPKTKAALNTEIGLQFPDNTTGAITPAILRQVTVDMVASWQQYGGVSAQTAANYTIQLSDYGQLVTVTNASPVAVTLPQATGSFTTFSFFIKNVGSTTATITPITSTINGGASLAVAPGNAFYVVSDGANWQAMGSSPNLLPLNNTWTGTNTFNNNVTMSQNVTATTPLVTNPVLYLVGKDNAANNLVWDGFGASGVAQIAIRRALGTAAAPSVVTNGTQMFSVYAKGYDGVTPYAAGAPGYFIIAAEDFSSGHNGTKLQFITVPIASTTSVIAAQIQASGGLSMAALADPGTGNIAANAMTLTTPLTVANGGTGLASGTSGGVLAFTATGTLASSGALAANAPVIGGGAGAAPSTGTRSGNTTSFATTSGTLGSGNCAKFDASGNIADFGAGCGGTGSPGGVNTQVQYNNAGSFGGITGLTTNGTNNVTVGATSQLTVAGTLNTTGTFQVNSNSMTFPAAAATLTQTIASGAAALNTTAVASATCGTTQSFTATGAASTDAVSVAFNADVTGTTGYIPSTSGMLTIFYWPSANSFNVRVCNNTSASITPGATVTLNFRVVR